MSDTQKEVDPKPVIVFKVTRNSDLTEGRGPEVTWGYFSTASQAVREARGINVQGQNGMVWAIGVPFVETPEQAFAVLHHLDTQSLIHNGRKWTDEKYDPKTIDPEWTEYKRLKEKFNE